MGYLEALQAWPQTILDWVKVVSTILGGLWALQTFWKSNEIKAAEILVKLEESFIANHSTLLDLEYLVVYNRKFKPALEKLEKGHELDYSENDAINAIEKTFRHFFTCWNVRQRTHRATLDDAYRYYLDVLCCKDDHDELRRYARKYWGKIYRWAQTARKPWPVRLWFGLVFFRDDVVHWVTELTTWLRTAFRRAPVSPAAP